MYLHFLNGPEVDARKRRCSRCKLCRGLKLCRRIKDRFRCHVEKKVDRSGCSLDLQSWGKERFKEEVNNKHPIFLKLKDVLGIIKRGIWQAGDGLVSSRKTQIGSC